MLQENIGLSVSCRRCSGVSNLSVGKEDYVDWREGSKLIQDAFPYLNPGKREILISNTCEKCWDELFGFHGEEEDDE